MTSLASTPNKLSFSAGASEDFVRFEDTKISDDVEVWCKKRNVQTDDFRAELVKFENRLHVVERKLEIN